MAAPLLAQTAANVVLATVCKQSEQRIEVIPLAYPRQDTHRRNQVQGSMR